MRRIMNIFLCNDSDGLTIAALSTEENVELYRKTFQRIFYVEECGVDVGIDVLKQGLIPFAVVAYTQNYVTKNGDKKAHAYFYCRVEHRALKNGMKLGDIEDPLDHVPFA